MHSERILAGPRFGEHEEGSGGSSSNESDSDDADADGSDSGSGSGSEREGGDYITPQRAWGDNAATHSPSTKKVTFSAVKYVFCVCVCVYLCIFRCLSIFIRVISLSYFH